MIVKTYEQMIGESPKQIVPAPLEKGDNPELDTSKLLDSKGIEMYQSIIGALQEVVTIESLDITTAVMTMAGFRTAPRVRHPDQLKRVYGYLSKMLRSRTEEPEYSYLPGYTNDMSWSGCGEMTDIFPHEQPEPLGNYVILTLQI
jgi:hypothetical protein